MRRMKQLPSGVVLMSLLWVCAGLLGDTTAAGITTLAPTTPANWSSSLVVSTKTNDTQGATQIFTTDTVYVNMAFKNTGADIVTPFNVQLVVDGTVYLTFPQTGLTSGTVITIKDKAIQPPLGFGQHQVQMVLDPAGENNVTVNSFQIVYPPPIINSSLTLSGTVGQFLTYTISASNFPTAFGANVSSIVGLSFDPNTGTIFGTPADISANVGVLSVTISASNGTGQDIQTLVITLAPNPPHITSSLLAKGSFGVQFQYSATATGTPSVNISFAGLPAGLQAGSNNISGIPTQSGTYAVQVTATNSAGTDTKTLTIQITAPPIINSPLVVGATVGQPFSYAITTDRNDTQTFAASGLPTGLTLDTQSGVISGTPSGTVQPYLVTLTATNNLNPTVSACATSTTTGVATALLTLGLSGNGEPSITSSQKASGTETVPFIYGVTATNTSAAFAPISYSASFPAGLTGLSIDPNTGIIFGIPGLLNPIQVTTFPVTVTATNINGTSTPTVINVTINLAKPRVIGNNPNAPVVDKTYPTVDEASGSETSPFTYQAMATSYSAPGVNATTFSAVFKPSLPSGNVRIDANTGLLSGTPDVGDAGNYAVAITATNNRGSDTKNVTVLITSAAAGALKGILPPYEATAILGCPFEYFVNAPGTSCYSISLINGPNGASLPPHLVANNSSLYSGTMQSGDPTGDYNLRIQVFIPDSSGVCNTKVDQKTLLLHVLGSPPPATPPQLVSNASAVPPFSNASTVGNLEAGFTTVGTAFSPNLNLVTSPDITSPNTPFPLALSISKTTPLPQGLALFPSTVTSVNDPVPQITGIPTVPGTSNVAVTALNAGGSDTRVISITVAGVIITSKLADSATVGNFYSYTINATGNSNSFNAIGLPAGLSIDTKTGIISGYPLNGTQSATPYPVTITATNPFNTGSSTLMLTINPAANGAPLVTSATSATAIWQTALTLPASATPASGQQYQITASNTPTSFDAKNLPAGLTIDKSTGIISGSTPLVGSYNVTLVATNASGSGASFLKLTVKGISPTFSPKSVQATAIAGQPFQYTVTASGTPAITYTAVSLPNGMTLNGNLLSATFPTTTGSVAAQIQATNIATDPNDPTTSDTLVVNITVIDPPVFTGVPPLTATAIAGSSFNYTITTGGTGSGTNVMSISAIPLPQSMALNGSTINNVGTTVVGVTNVTLTADNSAAWVTTPGPTASQLALLHVQTTLQISVIPAPPPPSIISPGTLNATVGTAISYNLQGSGGIAPYTFSVVSSPPQLGTTAINGIVFANVSSSTPTTAGTYTVTFTITDSANTSSNFNLTVNVAAKTGPAITSPSAVSAAFNTAFVYDLTVAANSGVVTWTVAPLPPAPGLTFQNTSTPAITGTPTTPGNYQFTITATNSSNISSNQLVTLNVTPPPPPVITSPTTVSVTVNNPISYQITATGSQPLTYSTSALDPSLNLTLSGSTLSNVSPAVTTKAGTYPITITATDQFNQKGTATLTITVNPTPTAPVITSPLTAGGSLSSAFSYVIIATGTAPIVYNATPLPPGLAFSRDTISGMPTQSGTFNVTLTASNGSGSVNAQLVITISAIPPPVITSVLTDHGQTGSAYSYTITATGITPINYSATGLPPGLTNNGPLITGTPTQAGTYNVTLTASNGGGPSTATLTLTIAGIGGGSTPTPAITSAGTALAVHGSPFAYTITATPAPATGFTATGLPSGLSVDASTGLISGTTTTDGTFTVNIGANTSAGLASAVLTLTVNSGAPIITSPLSASGTQSTAFSYTITATGIPTISFTAAPLPDGLSLSGSTISGIPTGTGTFNVLLGAQNSAGSTTQTLVITLAVAPDDIQGKGFPTELEVALGIDPNSTNTPFGGATAAVSRSLNITSGTIKLDFAQLARDSVTLKGSFSAPSGFAAPGQHVTIVAGGIVQKFALDTKGTSSTGTSTFKLSVKQPPKGVGGGVTGNFMVKLVGSFQTPLAVRGLVNDDVKAASVTVRIFMLFPDVLYEYDSSKIFSYTAHKGKSGTATVVH